MGHARRLGGEEWFLIIALCVVIAAYLFVTTHGTLAESVERWLDTFTDVLLRQGYWGAFILSFLSNSSVFIVIPYLPAIFFLGAIGLHPLLLGLIAGIAATIGEIVSYGIGWLGGRLLAQKHTQRFEVINDLLRCRKRLAPILIFLFGLLPIPDDILIVPLAMVRYPLIKALIPLTLGKVSNGVIAAYLGSTSYTLAERSMTSVTTPFAFIAVVLTVLVIYSTLKVKWERFFTAPKVDKTV